MGLKIVTVTLLLLVLAMAITAIKDNQQAVVAELTDEEWLLYNDLLQKKEKMMDKYGISEEYLVAKGIPNTISTFNVSDKDAAILNDVMMVELKKDANADDPCGQSIYEDFAAYSACVDDFNDIKENKRK